MAHCKELKVWTSNAVKPFIFIGNEADKALSEIDFTLKNDGIATILLKHSNGLVRLMAKNIMAIEAIRKEADE